MSNEFDSGSETADLRALLDTGNPPPYSVARKAFLEHPVRDAEVPTEFAIGVVLPTLRWGTPAFTGHAGPAVRRPGTPLRLYRPDRWWAIDVHGRRLVAYARTTVVPFAQNPGPAEAVVDHYGQSIQQVRENLRLLDELMDAVIGAFFAGVPAPATLRGDLLEVLTSVIGAEPLPWSRELAPDFFAWLEAA